MIKLFTLFNLVGLSLFSLFFIDNVKITQDLPAHMQPGSEVRVTVTVDKAQISGFAKLQIDLPPGLSATAIDTRGASFTFSDGKAKFIWMALPTQASFKVSYTLAADAMASGSYPVTARLSYIENNERKTVDAAPALIIVGDGSPAIVMTEPGVKEEPEQQQAEAGNTEAEVPASSHMDDLVSAAPVSIIPDAPVTNTPGLPSQAGPGDVSASRTVTQVGPKELLVEVTIKKGALRGFGKLQENLPVGFTAIEKNNDDAIFSMTGRMLKFVWLNLPSKNELKVSYRLLASGEASGTYTINGEFGYLFNDLTQRAVVGSTSFTVNGDFELAQEEPVTPKPTETTTTTTATSGTSTTTSTTTGTAQTSTSGTTEETTTASSTTTRPTQATSTPAPETGITFKVQITAAHREVGKPYFIQRHNYSGDFSIEHHDGWIKYVTGSHDRYRAARDQRQSYIDAQYNFPGPFVTAYNNGERITVQEALMISKQQWVP